MWFELVDGDGKAVTSADYVEIPATASVARFRREVFGEVSRALPSNVIASNLSVFANRTAFNDGNAQPLDPESLLNVRDAKFIVQVTKQLSNHKLAPLKLRKWTTRRIG